MMPFTKTPCREELIFTGIVRTAELNERHFIALKARTTNGRDREAMFELAICYLHGYGCRKAIGAARTWFKAASNAGHAGASYMLYRLLTGQLATSALWRAAKQGHTAAAKFCQLRDDRPLFH